MTWRFRNSPGITTSLLLDRHKARFRLYIVRRKKLGQVNYGESLCRQEYARQQQLLVTVRIIYIQILLYTFKYYYIHSNIIIYIQKLLFSIHSIHFELVVLFMKLL